MKIGIFVYSQTGNTLSVAEKLKEKLIAGGHVATIEKITTVGEIPKDNTNIRFEKLPSMEKYEGLVIAAPVQAFSLCPVMSAWLMQMPAVSGKKIAAFVTKKLGNDWTGGSKAIGIISKAVKEKGGSVAASGIVHWADKKDKDTEEVVQKLGGLFA